MQQFKVIVEINQPVLIEVEGVGRIHQIELAQQLFNRGIIDYKCKKVSGRIRLTDNLINIAINELNLYPRWF